MVLGLDRPKFLASAINYIIYYACACISQPYSLKMSSSATWVSVFVKRGLQIQWSGIRGVTGSTKFLVSSLSWCTGLPTDRMWGRCAWHGKLQKMLTRLLSVEQSQSWTLASRSMLQPTRAMRKEYLDKYNNLCKIPSIILSFSVSSKPMECMTPNCDGLSQRKKAEGSVRRGVIWKVWCH